MGQHSSQYTHWTPPTRRTWARPWSSNPEPCPNQTPHYKTNRNHSRPFQMATSNNIHKLNKSTEINISVLLHNKIKIRGCWNGLLRKFRILGGSKVHLAIWNYLIILIWSSWRVSPRQIYWKPSLKAKAMIPMGTNSTFQISNCRNLLG